MLSKSFNILLIVLSVLIVAYASIYYLPLDLPEGMGLLENGFGPLPLAVHAASGSLALLTGPFQFFPGLRERRPKLHHALGRLYVAGCLVGGASGIVLAIGSTSGPLVTLGFGSLGLFWLVTTWTGLRLAIQRRITEHRRWMIRSFALTLAAVTLRFELPLMQIYGLDFPVAYLAVSYLCWVPNILLAEIYLRVRGNPSVPAGLA